MPSESKVFTETKSNLAAHMAASAAFFTRQAHLIESTNPTNPPSEHKYYCISAIVNSVAFLECAISEIYLASFDSGGHHFGSVHKHLKQVLAAAWPQVKEWSSVLPKYELAIALAREPAFDHGTPPYQPVEGLVKLRNGLVHYKPEWSERLDAHRKLEKRLKTYFALSQYHGAGQAFFPEGCLGHSCASWAVTTSVDFYRDFRKRLHLDEDTLLNTRDLGVVSQQ